MPSSRLDFFKALSKRGIASRKVDRLDAHQVRTKATHGTDAKQASRYSIVRSCSCTLKGMVFSLEGRFVRCAYGANKTQHCYRIDPEVA